jgi:hypothetical protein
MYNLPASAEATSAAAEGRFGNAAFMEFTGQPVSKVVRFASR